MRMRLADYDDRDAVESLFLTFVQRGDRWYVAGDADLATVGLDTFRSLWDLGRWRCSAPRTSSCSATRPRRHGRASLAVIAEEAIGELDERWDQPWSHRVPLILPGSIDELGAHPAVDVRPRQLRGLRRYGAVRDSDWEATAPRIYIQDRNLSRYPRDYQVERSSTSSTTPRSAPLAGPAIPAWVHEGVADWVALGPAHRRAQARRQRRPPAPRLRVHGRRRRGIVRSYAESRSADVVPRRPLRASARPASSSARWAPSRWRPAARSCRVDRALTRVAGLTVAQLEKEWAAR